ncbi:NAD(P)/FAD-dependent oxidoreductase [Rhodococcus sp. NPDC003318]|uniref:NAD(P)/FAD-dependent oxidoreductase n=1 Tax=Rhodococcus sp. NPDC003318 TaxID=3364503 RepID=UPI0036755BCA
MDNAGTNDRYDVVVVGGGAAGLGGALSLSRARRSVLVIDSGTQRNAPAAHMHNYLGREGAAPAQLIRIGRGEVAAYGTEFLDGEVVDARPAEGGFTVTLGDGRSVSARQILVTSGLVDELPDVPGLRERWGRDVLHCPYCHGWEVRDTAIGVLATSTVAVHQALMWRQWSDDVVVFAHTAPAFAADDLEKFAAMGIEVVDGAVAGLEVADDRLTGVRLATGETVAREALVVPPRFTARAGFLAGLGLDPVQQEMGGEVIGNHIAAGPTGATDVAGVWAAGNVTDPRAQVISAASAGVFVGSMINSALIEEDVAAAVADRRASRVG